VIAPDQVGALAQKKPIRDNKYRS